MRYLTLAMHFVIARLAEAVATLLYTSTLIYETDLLLVSTFDLNNVPFEAAKADAGAVLGLIVAVIDAGAQVFAHVRVDLGQKKRRKILIRSNNVRVN